MIGLNQGWIVPGDGLTPREQDMPNLRSYSTTILFYDSLDDDGTSEISYRVKSLSMDIDGCEPLFKTISDGEITFNDYFVVPEKT